MIRVAALTKAFGPVLAVDQATFEVAKGVIFGIIGPNGAGKSTLIRMLTTLLPPTSGCATVAGYDIVREPGLVRRHIGYVPQLLSADSSLTAMENMLVSARLYGIPAHERKQRIDGALAAMGLSEAADHLVSSYSGGMIRRLEIAQSMLHRPTVLFMDEPTVGLDPSARDAVWQHVLALRSEFQTTMLITSHYMEEVEQLCDQIALIARGRIVALGTAAELEARVGPGADLDDVFNKLVGIESESEAVKSYAEVRRARRAARQHG